VYIRNRKEHKTHWTPSISHVILVCLYTSFSCLLHITTLNTQRIGMNIDSVSSPCVGYGFLGLTQERPSLTDDLFFTSAYCCTAGLDLYVMKRTADWQQYTW